jgi:hypothetical protein
MSEQTPITVAHGDGIGPEIMEALLRIIQESGAALEIETVKIGEKVYLRSNTAGIDPSSWESLRRTKVFYKAPITTWQGGGYANIRPCAASQRNEWVPNPARKLEKIEIVGIDLYMGSNDRNPKDFGDALSSIPVDGVQLRMVDNRGTIVWPGGMSETFVTDSYRCLFQPLETSASQSVTHAQTLYEKVTAAGYDIV